MDWITNPQAYAALITLTVLEIVLGIDNIIFITILSDRLPESQQPRARTLGLFLAMFTRAGLLFSINWLMGLERELFEIAGHGFSGHDLILIAGGLFLIYKATVEIYEKVEHPEEEEHGGSGKKGAAFFSIIVQIVLLDIVFSLDSVITAVGMADDLGVMITAVVIAVLIMMFAINPVADFVNEHPSLKMLALSFLLLVGLSLVSEAFGTDIPKAYLYFAIGFSIFVEMLNFRRRAPRKVGTYSNPVVITAKPRTQVEVGASDTGSSQDM
jgi:predicted tellurium resistance membrane protein TerC